MGLSGLSRSCAVRAAEPCVAAGADCGERRALHNICIDLTKITHASRFQGITSMEYLSTHAQRHSYVACKLTCSKTDHSAPHASALRQGVTGLRGRLRRCSERPTPSATSCSPNASSGP